MSLLHIGSSVLAKVPSSSSISKAGQIQSNSEQHTFLKVSNYLGCMWPSLLHTSRVWSRNAGSTGTGQKNHFDTLECPSCGVCCNLFLMSTGCRALCIGVLLLARACADDASACAVEEAFWNILDIVWKGHGRGTVVNVVNILVPALPPWQGCSDEALHVLQRKTSFRNLLAQMGAATPQVIAWHVSWLRVVLYQEAASTFTYRKQFLGCNEVLGDQDDGDTAELCGQSNKVKTTLKVSQLPQGSSFHLVWLSNAQQTCQFSLISLHARAFLVVQMACSEVTLTGLHDNFAWTLLGTLFGMFSIASKSLGVCILWKKSLSKTPHDNHGITWWTGEPFFKPNVPGVCGCKCSNSLCYVDPIPCGYTSLRCECICEFWECSDDDINLWSWP